MSKSEKIQAIAQLLAQRCEGDKRPYSRLKWIAEQCSWQYKATQSEVWEAYFAAVNILKAKGVENAKRKPLTNLSKKERAHVRKIARHVAEVLSRHLEVECKVTRMPLQTEPNGEIVLQISVQYDRACQGFIYPTVKQLREFEAMPAVNQAAFMYKYAQQFFSEDDKISRDIDTIKTQLEALL